MRQEGTHERSGPLFRALAVAVHERQRLDGRDGLDDLGDDGGARVEELVQREATQAG